MLTDGIIIIDKPEGLSSYDCIREIKQKYPKNYKIGHCGTLDPFATGLLIILVGKATKLQNLFMSESKIYSGTVKLGIKTDTADITGKVIKTSDYNLNEDMLDGLKDYSYYQTPPQYSAKKINGITAYKLARSGEAISLKPSLVKIFEYNLKRINEDCLSFKAIVSKGTYIRTLNEDYFENQNILATTKSLRRLASGEFNLELYPNGTQIDLVQLSKILKLKSYILTNENEYNAVINANELTIANLQDKYITVYYNNQLLAYYEKGKNNKYKPTFILK